MAKKYGYVDSPRYVNTRARAIKRHLSKLWDGVRFLILLALAVAAIAVIGVTAVWAWNYSEWTRVGEIIIALLAFGYLIGTADEDKHHSDSVWDNL